MKRITLQTFAETAESLRAPYHKGYLAMYSSLYGGITTEPVLMLLPLDDHMAHRGDGVFEAIKCCGGNIYNLKAHLARLRRSASALDLKPPRADEEITRLAVETVRAGGSGDCIIRLYVSRGPGSFDADPGESVAPQLYIAATAAGPLLMNVKPGGARAVTSAVVPKLPEHARVKSCNYIQNVLMKKEAREAGVDFAVSFDHHGNLLEGATSNFGIVTPDAALRFPRLDGILAGTTMLRVVELAARLVADGTLKSTGYADIPKESVRSAAEMLVTGTTVDAGAVTEFDGRKVGTGKPGTAWRKLSALLAEDMKSNMALLTPVF